MDKLWAKQNISDSKHLLKDLEHHRFKHAYKEANLIGHRLEGIKKEIRSGKAKKE